MRKFLHSVIVLGALIFAPMAMNAQLQVTNSDFQYMATEPEDMQFRVQIVY